MVATLIFILSVGVVIYAIKTYSEHSDEEYNDQHKNDIGIIVEEIERDLETTTEEKIIEYLKEIEYNTRSAKNTLMFIRVLYIIALSIGGLILISTIGR